MSKFIDPIPDHLKFGYEYNIEMAVIRKKLIADGADPDHLSFHHNCVSEYQENHKDDLTFRQKWDLAYYNGEPWTGGHIKKSTEPTEIEQLRAALELIEKGHNDPRTLARETLENLKGS